MATCEWCNSAGFFVRVDEIGLCSKCGPQIKREFSYRLQAIEQLIEAASRAKTLKTKLHRCDDAIAHASELRRFENVGIVLGSKLPSQLIREYTATRDDLILAEIKVVAQKAISKSELSTSPRIAVTAINNGILRIREFENLLSNPNLATLQVSELKELAHSTKLNGHIEAAKKAEFKGQTKKAIDQYQEALYFLKNDDIDDSKQIKEITNIEGHISRLSKPN